MDTYVIDTNIWVMSLSRRSPYHLIVQSLVQGKFQLAVSLDILLEYEEKIAEKYSEPTALFFMELLNELPNVKQFTSYFQWQLIEADPEDNKFADIAVAANAKLLVSEDRHFSVLKEIRFPIIRVARLDEFMAILR